MSHSLSVRALLTATLFLSAYAVRAAPVEPILDVHLHALPANDQGPPPLAMCTPMDPMPTWDQSRPVTETFLAPFKHPACKDPVWSPMTDEAVMRGTIAIMERRNVIGVVSGRFARVKAWRAAAPDRVLPSLMPDLPPRPNLAAELAGAKAKGDIAVLGELGFQYEGISPDDPKLEPIWAAAEANDIPVAPYWHCLRSEWRRDPEAALDAVEAALGYPVFTKPPNMGSSVGVCKCRNREELRQGMEEAARFDRKILVEAAVPNAREIEVSVLGNDAPIASVPGEIVPNREFYDYAAKYLGSSDDDSKLLIPAPLSDGQTALIRALAIRAFRAIDGSGLSRADFLMDAETGALYINEVNTMPGFTSISMYPKMWEATGLAYSDLITRLIELAIERHGDKW